MRYVAASYRDRFWLFSAFLGLNFPFQRFQYSMYFRSILPIRLLLSNVPKNKQTLKYNTAGSLQQTTKSKMRLFAMHRRFVWFRGNKITHPGQRNTAPSFAGRKEVQTRLSIDIIVCISPLRNVTCISPVDIELLSKTRSSVEEIVTVRH